MSSSSRCAARRTDPADADRRITAEQAQRLARAAHAFVTGSAQRAIIDTANIDRDDVLEGVVALTALIEK